MERHTQLAKDIRHSLKTQHAYLNSETYGRTRVYDVIAKMDGSIAVKIIVNRPGELGHGGVRWVTVGFKDSMTIFACTPMEETLTLAI